MEKELRENRLKVFVKVTDLLNTINENIALLGVKFEIREEYAIEYLKQILTQYVKLYGFDPEASVRGKGHHKTTEHRLYGKLTEYIKRLKNMRNT